VSKAVALNVREYLTAKCWPEPIQVSSGNGVHLLYRGDGPAADYFDWRNALRFLYRFAHQRSLYLTEMLTAIENEEPPADDLSFRLWLLRFRGIGPKTASWITRNWKNSDNVAIIDVHVCRAGELIGLYRDKCPRNDYFRMVRDFLLFAQAVGVRASVLDVIIWSQMRRWGGLVDLAS
jgi:thermostable 8-oxoguanine DNA glycosylase